METLPTKVGVGGSTPTRAYWLDAGLDLYAAKDYTVEGLTGLLENQRRRVAEALDALGAKGDRRKAKSIFDIKGVDFDSIHADIETQTHFAIPPHHVGIVFDKSGVGKKRVKIFGRVIDSGYRGPIIVMVTNFGKRWHISAGTKVGQLVILPIKVLTPDLLAWVDEETERGNRGFGSSGI